MSRRSILIGSVVLLLAAAYMPARIYASNLDKFPHPDRLLLVVAVYWLLGWVGYWLIVKITKQNWAGLASGATFALLVGAGGSLASRTSSLAALVIVAALSLGLGVVLARLSEEAQRFTSLLVVALAVTGPVAAYFGAERYDDGEVGVTRVTTATPSDLQVTPDIFVIVLDAFPGETALQDVYRHPLTWAEVEGVERIDAWTSYPITLGSVASLLEMGHPLEDRAILDGGTRDHLARIIAGDNRLRRILDGAGYETYLVESGWSRSYCAESIDVCVHSAFLDEGIFETVHQSVFSEMMAGRYGSGMTSGALNAIEWMSDALPRMAVNDQPEFVFASVVLPHPPLMLDRECQLRPEGWRGGNSVYVWDGVVEQRLAAFLEQIECVAQIETRLLAAIPDDALVVFLSDHGGDSRGQLSIAGHQWSNDDIVERMNVHLAVRSPIECPLDKPVFVAGVVWELLWCLGGSTPTADFGPTMFIADRIAEPKVLQLEELSAEVLRELGVLE